MTHEISIGRSVVEEGPWLIQVERQSGYGSVPGLDDSELADPVELERQVFVQEWGPVLALPVMGSRSGFHPGRDELGRLDWGAYGTVDFERLYGSFDKARYKADKLREELSSTFAIFEHFRRRFACGSCWRNKRTPADVADV